MKTLTFKLTILSVFFCIPGLCLSQETTDYHNEYKGLVVLASTMDDAISTLGNPIRKISQFKNTARYLFKDVDISVYSDRGLINSIIIYDKSYRDKNGISVGDEFEIVKHLPDIKLVKSTITDTRNGIIYWFDNNRVTQIVLTGKLRKRKSTDRASAISQLPVPQGFDIYREPIVTPQHLDWLWQDYLLHENIAAIGKITSALRLCFHAGAVKKAKNIKTKRELTETERQEAFLDSVFQAAMWSLESNAKKHPPVLAELKRIEAICRGNTDLSYAYLLIILSKVAPEEFKAVYKANEILFSTPTGKVSFQKKTENSLAL